MTMRRAVLVAAPVLAGVLLASACEGAPPCPTEKEIGLDYLIDTWDGSDVRESLGNLRCATFGIEAPTNFYSADICEFRTDADRTAGLGEGLTQLYGTRLLTSGPDPYLQAVTSQLAQLRERCED